MLPAAERTAEEEERFRLEERAPVAAADDDDATPLDEPAEPPRDLGEIPLSRDHEPVVDPQEDDDEVRLHMPGEAYPGEGGAPDVGRPAPDDPTVRPALPAGALTLERIDPAEAADRADDDAIEAAHLVEVATEWVERAFGRLLDAHHDVGHAQLMLLEAADALERAGHPELARRAREEVAPLDVIAGRWTYQIVDEFRDHMLSPVRAFDEDVRRAAGRRRAPPLRGAARSAASPGRAPASRSTCPAADGTERRTRWFPRRSSPDLAQELDRLRAEGCEVFGPGPMTPGETAPIEGPGTPALPGSHVQIRCGHRFVEGLGGTPDEAVRDAIAKLEGYDPTGNVIG